MSKNPSNQIRKLRMMKCPPWTQARLAIRVGCTQKEISAYECGTRGLSLSMAVRLARVLGQPVETIVSGLVEVIDYWLGERSREGVPTEPEPGPVP